jgi:Ca2+:H+ antiporter
VGRKLLWGSLALAPATIVLAYAVHPGKVTLFVLAAAALIPLAWLIGEATEHAAEHTGPGIGGFLNASFGNAPELIIALFAVADNLPEVVRGSLSGSVVSNLLLVFGITQLAAPDKTRFDRRSLLTHISLVLAASALLVIPAFVGYHGDPERHTAVVVSIPISVLLLLGYLVFTGTNLRRHREQERRAPSEDAWTLSTALMTLGIATAATAVVSEILVHSLDAFAHAVGLSEFFIATVIVAIVGNAAEHGGAVVIARRGRMRLASEIAISSSAQVALLVMPIVMLASLGFAHPLPLTFRWVELTWMAAAALLAGTMIADAKSRRYEGAILVTAYVAAAACFFVSGNR